MKELQKQIDALLQEEEETSHDDIVKIKNEKMFPPFSSESLLLVYLIAKGKLSYDDYTRMVEEYTERQMKSNKYLFLYDMAPRTFGETWGEQYIRERFPEFIKATKKNLSGVCPGFDGEFDLWLDGIRVEVKACRANSTKTKGSLSSRAYSHEEAKNAGYKYHYEQLKPSCCDVFIWIGVCKNELMFWVLSDQELLDEGFGPQHRNENTGVDGTKVFEGQVFMTEEELQPYLVKEKDILSAVKAKGKDR